MMRNLLWRPVGFAAVLVLPGAALAGEFVVATYNLHNYVGKGVEGRPAKSAAARGRVSAMIARVRPDVLALQEMGTTNLLQGLRADLNASGLDYPHWIWVKGADPDIHLAVLSRFPLKAARAHDQVPYLLDGRRLLVSRGFAEVEVQVHPGYRFTLFNAHLKSKRPVLHADQSEIRLAEAKALRELVQGRIANAAENLLVVGDLNDNQDAPPLKVLVGRGRSDLRDLRPLERIDGAISSGAAWTYHYRKEDTYSRFDYILANAGMAREHLAAHSYVAGSPEAMEASDHRPVVAAFSDVDR